MFVTTAVCMRYSIENNMLCCEVHIKFGKKHIVIYVHTYEGFLMKSSLQPFQKIVKFQSSLCYRNLFTIGQNVLPGITLSYN